MLKISFTKQYLKDLELMKRRHLPKSELDEVVKLLSEEQPLLPKHKDHGLKGIFSGYRECHIRPDWLLIYNSYARAYPHRHAFRPVLAA